ncbi:MAG: hypothetical protein IPM52_02225 [Bacteroidetes bacterium]|nr:hypothetical protein [Bacteroidota bacterium]
MKRIVNISFGLLLLILACQKEPFIRHGFNTELKQGSTGYVVVFSAENNKTLLLQGSISINSGSLLIELIDPHGEKCFSKRISDPGTWQINESFGAYSGYWKLRYQSIEGEGKISLHLNIIQ